MAAREAQSVTYIHERLVVFGHFAHGDVELRNQEDTLPGEYVNGVSQQQELFYHEPYCNYKTVKCTLYEKTGACKFGTNCKFAHGEHEMRNPHDPLNNQQV